MSDVPSLQFEAGATEEIIKAFDWEINSNGYVVSESGLVTARDGKRIHIDSIARIGDDANGNPVPIRDSFTNLVQQATESDSAVTEN